MFATGGACLSVQRQVWHLVGVSHHRLLGPAGLEAHFGVVADHDALLAGDETSARNHEQNGRHDGGDQKLPVSRLQVVSSDGEGGVVVGVEAGKARPGVVVGAVLAELAQEIGALVLQRVDAALLVDHQAALVGYNQVHFSGRHPAGGVESFFDRALSAQPEQVREIGQIGQRAFGHQAAVDAIATLDASASVGDCVARGHQHVRVFAPVVFFPRVYFFLPLVLYSKRFQTLREVNLKS